MKRRTALLLSLIALAPLAQAIEPGQPVAPWTLLDQFDQPFTLGQDTRVLLVARSMAAAKLVNAALEAEPKGYLEQRHIAYVADIERMPAVAKLFAIPQMRSAKYRILLDQEGRVAPRYEGARETVQWLAIEDGKLAEQRVFEDAESLKRALSQL